MGAGSWRAGVLVLGALAAGCAGEPTFPERAQGDPRLARKQLAAALAQGPAALEVVDPPVGLSRERIADLAERGVLGLTVRFAAEPGGTAASRLVLRFADLPRLAAPVCGGGVDAGSGPVLTAAWCDGEEPVALIAGYTGRVGGPALERLIWQATRRLFEDDYAQTYGIDVLGVKVRLGGSVGF